MNGLDAIAPLPALRVIRVNVNPLWDPGVAVGIAGAIDAGADIVNLSMGSPCDSACQFFGWDPFLDPTVRVLQFARDRGVVVVAAAGNDGRDLSPKNQYYVPCELGDDLVLCVGSVQESGSLSGFTNFNGGVAVYAPGEDLFVPDASGSPTPASSACGGIPSPGLLSVCGTSVAAPFVVGVLSAVVATQGKLDTAAASRFITASASTATGIPILDAAALIRRSLTVAEDHFEKGAPVSPLPTTGELLTLTDEDVYSFAAKRCETVEITIDYTALVDGANAPYVNVFGPAHVPFTVSDPTPNQRVVRAGPLDESTYTLMLGSRPDLTAPAQLPLGYTLGERRMPGTNCEDSVLVDATAPARVEAGRRFFATATFRNTGATVWRPGTYRVAAEVGGADFSFTEGLL